MSAASFFAAPSYGGDREPARPKAVNPVTGKEQSWTRASSFAAPLDNPHGLIKSRNRLLIQGLAQRPDLCRMILAGVPSDDKGKLDEIIDQALGMMSPEAKANEGTAAHAALSHAWLHPSEPVVEEFVPLVAAFARALREHGLTPVATEQRVLNLAYDSMGNLDWVLQESDGTKVIGDVKTGDVQRAMLKFAVQLAMYAGSRYRINPDGTVEPIPWTLAQSHGVLIHIDLENGNAVSVYRVDLNIGRFGAGIAEHHRAFQKLNPLTPYVRPVVERKASVSELAQAVQDAGGAVTVVGPIEVMEPRPASVVDGLSRGGVSAPPSYDEAVPPVAVEEAAVRLAAQSDISYAEALVQVREQDPAARFDELMKLDKAPLQMLLKNTHGWADISHNRRWLARAIVALEQGLESRDVVKYAAAKDEPVLSMPMTVPKAAQAVTEADAQRATGPSTETLLEAIAGAHSEGALEALRTDIVERRGDQAWTDELAAAARVRVTQLLAAPTNAVSPEAREAAVIEQIAQCATQQALKELWERTTLGGTVLENWTSILATAGTSRLEAIKAATPPPPANPFG